MSSQFENTSFKRAKLEKTKSRRDRLARGREHFEGRSSNARNDLLPTIELKTYRVGDLKPPKNRTRKDDPQHIARHKRSIQQFGFTQPILARDDRVYDGWSRVLAAKELGLDEVPAIECNHLTDAEARALALASNRLGELAEWDLDELRTEFIELIELEVDLDATGFTIEEQDIILLDPLDAEESEEADDVEELPQDPVTEIGDLWELGPHRVLCGNALKKQSYNELLAGEPAHAVLTDPPYNVPIAGNVSGLGKKVHSEFAMASGEMSGEEFQSFLDQVFALLTAILIAGGVIFSFMDWRGVARVYAAGEKAGLNLINLLVWYKQSGSMGSLYRSAHELAPVFCKGSTPRVNNVKLGKNGRDRCNVIEAPGANRPGSSANEMLAEHATPKPVSICEDMILDVTKRGEIVLDCFLGSGTTLVAAERTDRRCCGIELDPKFVDVTIRRWEKLTGREAVLAETGESFAGVQARRQSQAVAPDKVQPQNEGTEQ
uniref:site-specific DNA-methyltransferase n=1 Tax=uncultured Altererythrobacter sp. TaxID=500840 RepID=UPI002621997B|nr:site-specific DNA-methyltransferase [uncultured Altererythrobacter sp.]